MKILLVSQMYPGPDDPDLGAFIQGIEHALADRGHEIERVVTAGRGGGKRRHLSLARKVRGAAKPDVVYAHFLVPTGLSAALFGRAPLVATAHGRDVRNIGAYPGIRAATRFVAVSATSTASEPVIYLSPDGPADYRIFVSSKHFSARDAAALIVGARGVQPRVAAASL